MNVQVYVSASRLASELRLPSNVTPVPATTLCAFPASATGATHVVLAVPVCPVDAEEGLRVRYDDVIAVTKPQERRTLRWHYETFA